MNNLKSILTASAIALIVGVTAPALAGDDKHHDDKEHVHCDRTKDKNCKDEHDHSKDADKHQHKDGDKHHHKDGDGHDHDKEEAGKSETKSAQ